MDRVGKDDGWDLGALGGRGLREGRVDPGQGGRRGARQGCSRYDSHVRPLLPRGVRCSLSPCGHCVLGLHCPWRLRGGLGGALSRVQDCPLGDGQVRRASCRVLPGLGAEAVAQ